MPNQDIPVVGPLLGKIFGSRNERFVKKYTQRVDAINALEPQMRPMTDEELRAKTKEFRDRIDGGESADDMLVEVFAVAREAMDRSIGIRNVLNPEHGFDPNLLSGDARAMFDRVAEEAKSLEPAAPEGRFLGCVEPVPVWHLVDFPPELYEAIRALYPESRPPFRARPFDVQLIGGMVLGQGKIAEMKTGEGKTIVAPLAAYMAACLHQQVHVVTVNDYLVQRDRDWTFPFFAAAGLTVGAIHPQHTQPEEVKRQMYRCDVVYGTTSEFGFDYLRDNMKRSVDDQVQRKRQFAIVDEVDSILIDEARTPLIISGPAKDEKPAYDVADKLARHLVAKQKPWQDAEDAVRACKEKIKGLEGDIRQTRDKADVPAMQKQLAEAKEALPALESARDDHPQFYELEMDRRSSHLTHEGIAEAQRVANIGSFYVDENMDVPHLLEQSLRAHAVYQRDKDYIVMDVPDRFSGKTEASVVIVDTNTGRPMIGRQWSDGLHQAVEAKEGVPIKQETQTVASVTIQNFYKMYKRLAGMTGTADTEAQEFHDIYHLDVVAIPTNKPVIRSDYDDLLFLREKDKWDAIVDEIKHFHDVGRPILVGTTSVEKSEMLGAMLSKKHGIKHQILNAKQHEREANVVEDAGELGAVMIATNMAGRGTDIKLAKSSREQLVEHWLRRSIASKSINAQMSEEELRENIYRKIAATELKDEGVRKRDAEEMPFEELQLRLLRKWATQYTWASPNKIETMGVDELMEALDGGGRFSLHRVRWFDNVQDLGGLHVIGTERHESRRIDNQLRGRSGRQGDKGSSRFFVSLEDDLMKMFAGETTMKVLSRFGMKEGDAIEHPWLSKNVERAQRKVEERNFQVRKNILEYDEIAELQRQQFYGLRQRVLEGRDVKGLIFEYIEEASDDAIEEFLDTDYPSQCAAEFARQKLDFSIMSERLRGKTVDEMDVLIRKQAKDDAASMIDVTIGEYMPIEGSEISVDFDSAGLVNWAKQRFGVELDAGEIRSGGIAERRHVRDMLEQAAFDRIDEADLSGLNEFVQKNYGARCLVGWVKEKFAFEVPVEDIVAAQKDEDRSPRDPILEKTRELYRVREIQYPIDFILELTMMRARQNPADAFDQLGVWANRRFGIDLKADEIRTTPPAKMRERLNAESEKFVDEDRLNKEIDAAIACESDEILDQHLTERFGVGITDRMKYLEPEEREDAVRARVENLLRAEQLHFERTILLETLDQCWREHLYEMDKLRDGISFRAFSQQDPRIAFKREGARLFAEMLETVRDRVTDYIFKARIRPADPAARAGGPMGGQPGGPGKPPSAPPPPKPRRPAPSVGGGAFGGGITGPGFDAPPAR